MIQHKVTVTFREKKYSLKSLVDYYISNQDTIDYDEEVVVRNQVKRYKTKYLETTIGAFLQSVVEVQNRMAT